MREAAEVAAALIKPFEGCHRRLPSGLIVPYICPAGVPTQGWGIVVPSLDMPPITPAMADAIFERELPRYMSQALALSPGLVRFPRRLGAVTSFVFNLGPGRYRNSTLRRRVNADDWDGAADECLKWVYGGGKRLRGLVLRREAEAKVLRHG